MKKIIEKPTIKKVENLVIRCHRTRDDLLADIFSEILSYCESFTIEELEVLERAAKDRKVETPFFCVVNIYNERTKKIRQTLYRVTADNKELVKKNVQLNRGIQIIIKRIAFPELNRIQDSIPKEIVLVS